jgi:tellurite resistance protein TehA-like permease
MRFPNTAFGVSMGLGGQSILWKSIYETKFTSVLGGLGNLVFFSTGCFVLVLTGFIYLLKLCHYPALVYFEWKHPVRAHFFNAPHLGVLMLCIGTPASVMEVSTRRGIWVVCAVVQTFLTQTFYVRWLFDGRSNIGQARPPFLLSTIGWPLLTILAQRAGIHSTFGLDFEAFFLGVGGFLYCLVVFSIFLSMHVAIGEKGSPALFLLLAPAAIGSVALAGGCSNLRE